MSFQCDFNLILISIQFSISYLLSRKLLKISAKKIRKTRKKNFADFDFNFVHLIQTENCLLFYFIPSHMQSNLFIFSQSQSPTQPQNSLSSLSFCLWFFHAIFSHRKLVYTVSSWLGIKWLLILFFCFILVLEIGLKSLRNLFWRRFDKIKEQLR